MIDGREVHQEEESDEIRSAIDAIVARRESREKSHRTASGLAAVARAGRPHGDAPLGYRMVGVKKERRLVVHEAEAAIVRRVFSEYLGGAGGTETARRLNDDRLRTRKGNRFSALSVLKLIDNPVYSGRIRLGDEVFDGTHEPLVSVADFERAQALRGARRSAAGGGRGRGPSGAHLLVGGLLKCSRCGSSMGAHSRRDGDYYLCRRRREFHDCDMPSIPRRLVDDQLLRSFVDSELHDVEATLDGLRQESKRRVEEAEALAEQAETRALAVAATLNRIKAEYLAGELPVADYRELKQELTEQRSALEAQAAQQRAHAAELAAEVERLDVDGELQRHLRDLEAAVAGEIKGAGGSVEALRAALTALFESITLYRNEELGWTCLFPILRNEAIIPRPEWGPEPMPWDEPGTPIPQPLHFAGHSHKPLGLEAKEISPDGRPRNAAIFSAACPSP